MAWPTVTESRQADLKGFAGTGVPAFLDRERRVESLGGRTVAQPSAPTVYVQRDVVGAWIISIFSYVSPPADMVNVDVRAKYPGFGLFCWTVGWWEVFSRVGRI